MCYGYGVSRELLYLFDASGSMLPMIEVPGFVLGALESIDGCPCPPFGVACYSGLDFGVRRTLLGRTQGSLSLIPRVDPNDEVVNWWVGDEDPMWALVAASKAWNYRWLSQLGNGDLGGNIEIGSVIVPYGSANPSVPGLEGRPKLGPPRRVIVWLGDENEYETISTDDSVAALNDAAITVLAINTEPAGSGIDKNGKAESICEGTGGRVLYHDFAATYFAADTERKRFDLRRDLFNAVLSYRWEKS